jgi:hypothetical protein
VAAVGVDEGKGVAGEGKGPFKIQDDGELGMEAGPPEFGDQARSQIRIDFLTSFQKRDGLGCRWASGLLGRSASRCWP